MRMNAVTLAVALMLASAAQPALAHPGVSQVGAFGAGVMHVVTGADHLLAAVAVGLWAALLGGRAIWALPTASLLAIAAGFALSVSGWPLPMAEPMVIASVLFFGGILAAAVRLPLTDALAAVFLLGLYHGSAHGTEISAAAALADGAGFLIASANLQAIGVGTALWLMRCLPKDAGFSVLKGFGAATTVAGVVLVFTAV